LPTLRRAGLRAVWRGLEGPPGALLDGAEAGGLLSLDRVSVAELPPLLATLWERGYRPGPVGELDGLRSETARGLLQRLWRAGVDDRFDRAHRVLRLTERARGLFRISRRSYPSPGLPLAPPGGPPFPPGTPAAELHIHSKRLVALAELSALTAYRAFGESLRDVAAALQEREDYREVELVWALTLFHEVLPPLGFGLQALENPRRARLTAFFMNLLRVLYGAKNTGGRMIVPQLAWMSRGALLERYGRASTPDESAILPRRGTGEA
ncbi:MAG: YkoP family protein, partial [Deinococcus sp.]